MTRAKSVQPRSDFDLIAIRKFLKALKPTPETAPLIAILRKQLSNYERGDLSDQKALKPMILRSVEKLSK